MDKVMFVSSAGGHLSELLELSPLFKKYDYVVVTEKTLASESLKDKYKMEFVKYGSRNYMAKYIFIFPYNVIRAIHLILKHKPKVIVTTGAHTGGIFLFVGKIFGAKTIYIESMAKIKSLSMTGKNVYKIADKFYSQWEPLAEKLDKCECIGRLK